MRACVWEHVRSGGIQRWHSSGRVHFFGWEGQGLLGNHRNSPSELSQLWAYKLGSRRSPP